MIHLCSHLALGAVVLVALVGAAPAQVTITLAPTKDNTLHDSVPAGFFSNATGSRMHCGNTTTGVTRRAVVAFDLSSIPSCATITSVELTLTMARTRAPDLPVNLHRLTSDWGEGTSLGVSGQGIGGVASVGDATWLHTFRPASFWTTPGGDFSATISASVNVGPTGSFTWGSNPTMVADAQSWADNPSTNFGWLIRTTETGTVTARAFHTREAAIAADRPSLQVTYTTASATPVGVGCNGSGVTPYSLTSNGPPTYPNSGFAYQMFGGPAAITVDVVMLGLTLQPPFPFGECFLQISLFPVGIVLPGAGLGFVPMPLPDLGAAGECFVIHAQAFGLDTATGLFVFSNALSLQVGK